VWVHHSSHTPSSILITNPPIHLVISALYLFHFIIPVSINLHSLTPRFFIAITIIIITDSGSGSILVCLVL